MATKAQLEVPAGMQAAARQHGVFRTAKVLRLEYGKLKRMAEATEPEAASIGVHRRSSPANPHVSP